MFAAQQHFKLKYQCLYVPLVEEKEAVVTLDLSQPVWLVIVLGGAEGGVEEDQQQNQPIESYGFDGSATVSTTDSIPAT